VEGISHSSVLAHVSPLVKNYKLYA
jgi:hypothetical protein